MIPGYDGKSPTLAEFERMRDWCSELIVLLESLPPRERREYQEVIDMTRVTRTWCESWVEFTTGES